MSDTQANDTRRAEKMTPQLVIYDTTLRDGTQAENFNLSVEDKVRITLKLDELGIDFVEGGWPGANPASTRYFEEIRNYQLKHTVVAAFGSTRNFNNPPASPPPSPVFPVTTRLPSSWRCPPACGAAARS